MEHLSKFHEGANVVDFAVPSAMKGKNVFITLKQSVYIIKPFFFVTDDKVN